MVSIEHEEQILKLIEKSIIEQPKNPYGYFQQLSKFAESGSFATKHSFNPAKPKKSRNEFVGIRFNSEGDEWAEKYIEPFLPEEPKKKETDGEGDEEPEEEEEEDGEEKKDPVGNFVQNQQLLSNAGVGISEVDRYRLYMAIQQWVKTQKKLESVRFFGIILGTHSNYYILEAEYTKEEEEEEEEEEEGEGAKKPEIDPEIVQPEVGSGTNRYVYYVSNDPVLGQWEALPDVDPSHIQAARSIRKFFTGDLNTPLESHPPFPGTEREYLRAQLARIAAATAIAPTGLMALDVEDEEEEEEENAEPKPIVPVPAPKTLAGIKRAENFDMFSWNPSDLSCWVHCAPSITQEQGRCTLYVPKKPGDELEEEEEEDEEETEEQRKKRLEGIEHVLPMFTPLNLENNLDARQSAAWTIRRLTDSSVSVKSLRWPGAVTVSNTDVRTGLSFTNIYIGHGHKYLGSSFTPQNVASVQQEYDNLPVTDDDTFPTLAEENDQDEEFLLQFRPPTPPPPEVDMQTESNGEENGEGDDEAVGEEAGEDDE